MSHNNRKPIFALLALATAFGAAPAFAQDATGTAPPQDAEQQSTQPTTAPPTTGAEQQTPTTSYPQTQTSGDASSQSAGATGTQKGWEEVDTDKDGTICKQEATASDGLTKIFDQADADADGKLTTDEYKDFVSKNYGEQPQTTP